MRKYKQLLLLFICAFITIFFSACKKDKGSACPTNLKITANNIKPTVGDRLTLNAHLGGIIYNWVGPSNFAVYKADGSDSIVLEIIKLKQTGWYYCTASLPGCNSVTDSIYIDVQYEQGLPPCSLTNNVITGTGIPTLQATVVTKQFDPTWQSKSLYATGSFGLPTYTFLFNSYNGNTEPKDGVYITSNVQVFDPLQDKNIIYAQCQYGSYFFKSHSNQKVYVSHVNNKLRISFCNLTFGGDNGNSVMVTSVFTGQITEK